MTYISQSSDFASYLEDIFIFDGWMLHFVIMSQCDATFYLKINVGHIALTYISQSIGFAIYFEDYLMNEYQS